MEETPDFLSGLDWEEKENPFALDFGPVAKTAPPNPFAALVTPETTSKGLVPTGVLPPCGDADCKRTTHRPDGSHYSTDPSERMKQMQAEGKVGPQFGQLGGPKGKVKKRALEIVADRAAELADDIAQVFVDGINPANTIGVRLDAAMKFLKVEEGVIDRSMKQKQNEVDNMNKSELVGLIQASLGRLNQAGAIAHEVEEMIYDAEEVREDEH